MYSNKQVKNPNPHKHVTIQTNYLDPELLDLTEGNNRYFIDAILRFFPGVTFFGLILTSFYLAVADLRSFFILVTLFSCYNLYMMMKIALFCFSYVTGWTKGEYRNFHEEYLQHRRMMKSLGHTESQLTEWNEVVHYVVLPNYKEHTCVLSSALSNLTKSKLARTNIIVCLAMEGRETEAEEKAVDLMKEHYSHFLDIIATFHPSNIPGEIPGKSSNDRWAIHEINQDVARRGLDPSLVCVTIADADSFVHPLYFESLTSQFCNDVKREEKIWQGAMICYKNYFSVPALTRCMATSVTLHELAVLANKNDLNIPFSTYSASLNLINVVGYDGDIIPEDWHFFIKSYFATGGRCRVATIPFPNICYAVESDKGWFASIKERFTQATRHHWGITEIVYFFRLAFRAYFINANESAKPNVYTTFKLFGKLYGPHLLAACGTFFLALPFMVLKVYEYLWHDSPIALIALNEWSLVFRILGYITFLPIIWLAFCNTFVVRKSLAAGQVDIRWYHLVYYVIETLIIFPIANLLFATLPVLYCSAKLFYTEQFAYISAAKPQAQLRSPSEVV